MRPIAVRLQPHGDYIEFIGGGDLHIGHPCFDKKKAAAHQAYILSDPDRYVCDLGDPIENNLKDSPGAGIFEQTLSPSEQKKAAKAYYWDIAAEGKLLGICESNHPDRSVKTADFSPTEYLAEVLRTEFIKYQAVFAITVGNSARGNTYLIHVRHFAGSASTPEGIQRQLRLKSHKIQGPDVHLAAHCHVWTYGVEDVIQCDRRGRQRQIEKHYATCSGFMGYSESYAEAKDYGLPSFGMASVRLYRDTHKVEVVRLLYS
jgi:hypothetical protein